MNRYESNSLIDTVKNDLTPSLGVTEPAAIAYAASAARSAVGGRVVKSVCTVLNSGIYKNSFTCAVPNSNDYGCAYAAAIGAIAGDADKKLMSLENVTEGDASKAALLVERGAATIKLGEISADIYIKAIVVTDKGTGEAVIQGKHDNITIIKANDIVVHKSADNDAIDDCKQSKHIISHTLSELLEYSQQADIAQLQFLREAVEMDMRLFENGKHNGLLALTMARVGEVSPDDARIRALLYACGAIEARVRGASAPAMAIAGSGSHGILCMLPIHAAAQTEGIGVERELRGIFFSCLVTMYIKALSGRLSASCGCVMAGGTGAALGLTLLYGGDYNETVLALGTMAASVTGMICHGGNTGCVLKAMTGVEMAFNACRMAMKGSGAESIHGILDKSPETVMYNMGYVSKGMSATESYIFDILRKKER